MKVVTGLFCALLFGVAVWSGFAIWHPDHAISKPLHSFVEKAKGLVDKRVSKPGGEPQAQ